MLNQFRQCYPQGSLISDLLYVDQGKYLVKTSIQVEGVTLVTGLGADYTLEGAEDRARARALAGLNLEATPQSENTVTSEAIAPQPLIPPTPSAPPPETQPVIEPLPTPEPVLEELPEVVEPPQPEPIVTPKKSKKSPKAKVPEAPAPPVEPTPPSSTNGGGGSFEASLDFKSEPEAVEPLLPVESTQAPPEPEETAPELDFSDIIAETNVELKRLGWTSEKGRDYLLATYGKRSRQLLSDEELVEFWRYLKTL